MVVGEQFRIIVTIMAFGFVFGFIIDCYQVFWRLIKPGRIKGYIGDFIFWILAGALAFFYLLHVNLGEVRLYVFLALIAGWGIYAYLLSYWVKLFLWRLLRWIKYFLSTVFRVITIPLLFLFRVLLLPLRPVKSIITKTGAKGKIKSMWSRIKPPGKI